MAAVLAAESFETPSLVVFDVDHWEGRQSELYTFLTGLKKDGRPVVILAVNSPFVPVDLRGDRVHRIANLTHELSLDDVLGLGAHLNKYLRPFGKEREPHEWRRFWEAHRPDYLTTSFAHFWIALEFWLKGQLDLNQSIQSWLYDSFIHFDSQDDLRLLLLEIAALSVERQPLPEGLMPLSPTHRRPFSVLLEDDEQTSLLWH